MSCDFFTSIVLVEELLKRKIPYVGTIRSNRREVCPEAKKNICSYIQQIFFIIAPLP